MSAENSARDRFIGSMTDQAPAPLRRPGRSRLCVPMTQTERPFSPGLEGVVAGETALALVDGANGRLLYRGYPIGELVLHGSYAQVAELLWTGEWPAQAHLAAAPLPDGVLAALAALGPNASAMDALRTAVSVWGA